MQEPDIRVIDPKTVRIPDFQREEVRKVVLNMKKDFVPDALGLPVVWQNGNGYLAIDGQQRLSYLREVGEDEVYVQVIHGSEQEAAKVYYCINAGRANLTPFNIYVSQLAALDPTAMEMDKILKKYGIELEKHRSRTAAFRDIHRRGLLDKTLRVVTETWGIAEEGALHYNFLYGMARYLEDVREQTIAKLPDALQGQSPLLIRTWAEAKHNEGKGSVRLLVAKRLAAAYRSFRRSL